MRPDKRKLKKWRKDSPMKSRSFAEKRGRLTKHVVDEVNDAKTSRGGKDVV